MLIIKVKGATVGVSDNDVRDNIIRALCDFHNCAEKDLQIFEAKGLKLKPGENVRDKDKGFEIYRTVRIYETKDLLDRNGEAVTYKNQKRDGAGKLVDGEFHPEKTERIVEKNIQTQSVGALMGKIKLVKIQGGRMIAPTP